ncbi:MAG: hypothetical protein WKF57_07800 [Nakamurella sp.]
MHRPVEVDLAGGMGDGTPGAAVPDAAVPDAAVPDAAVPGADGVGAAVLDVAVPPLSQEMPSGCPSADSRRQIRAADVVVAWSPTRSAPAATADAARVTGPVSRPACTIGADAGADPSMPAVATVVPAATVPATVGAVLVATPVRAPTLMPIAMLRRRNPGVIRARALRATRPRAPGALATSVRAPITNTQLSSSQTAIEAPPSVSAVSTPSRSRPDVTCRAVRSAAIRQGSGTRRVAVPSASSSAASRT